MSLPDEGDDGDDVEEDVTSQTPSRRHKINTGSSAEETSSLVSGGTAGGASGVAVAGRSGRKCFFVCCHVVTLISVSCEGLFERLRSLLTDLDPTLCILWCRMNNRLVHLELFHKKCITTNMCFV